MNNIVYENQRKQSDSYIPYVSRVIINSLGLDPAIWSIRVTTPEQDMKQAADLILTDGNVEYMIALRTRQQKYVEFGYFNDFTIRHEYKAGHKTEYEKILVGGYADMMFYGFQSGEKINRWLFMLVDEFRCQHDVINGIATPQDHIKYSLRENTDGKNDFYAYDINSFKNHDKLIIAHSDGYFKDVLTKTYGGVTTHSMKLKKDRIDGY